MILDNKVFSSFDHNYLSMSISKKRKDNTYVNIQNKDNTHIKTLSTSKYQFVLLAPLDPMLSFADGTPLPIFGTCCK